MANKHVADKESAHIVLNSTPDFCRVGNAVVPFEITQQLTFEKTAYATKVHARGEKVLLVESIVKGVTGNAGRGIKSQVSMGQGNVKVIDGCSVVYAEKRKLARHLDPVQMNGKV